jgi:hypothetical protein
MCGAGHGSMHQKVSGGSVWAGGEAGSHSATWARWGAPNISGGSLTLARPPPVKPWGPSEEFNLLGLGENETSTFVWARRFVTYRIQNLRAKKIVGGGNLCGLLARNTMVGGYMRGKKKKSKSVSLCQH